MSLRLRWCALLLLLACPAAAQQVLEHPSQVRVKPPTAARTDDAFRVWGGIKAGPDGSTLIVDANGVLQGIVPAPGSITFAQWDDNGCTADQFPAWSGSSWACQKLGLTNIGITSCGTNQILKYTGSAWGCANDETVGGPDPTGTVTSVGLTMPGIFSVAGSPITTYGSLDVTLASQSANRMWASPDNASGTPAFRAIVMRDLPAEVLTADESVTITGNWRFAYNTVFGEATTAQQNIHIYRASTNAGLRLQRGVDAWDLVAGNNLFQVVKVGGWVPLTFTADSIGISNASPNSGYRLDVTGNVKLSGNLSVGSYFENSLLPAASDTYNLGDPSKRWWQAWISQINATVFAEETVQLLGGYFMVVNNAGSFKTAVTASALQIDFGKTFASGELPAWVLVRGKNTVGTYTAEYMRITSLVSGTTYNVYRDIQEGSPNGDGIGQPWDEGQPYALLGQPGDGRIEMFAYSGIPRIGVFRQGATAMASDEIVRVGGLDGMPTMSSAPGRYGLFVGADATNYLKYQRSVAGTPTGDDDKLIVQGTIQATAGFFGSAANVVSVSSSGLDIGASGAIRSNGATWDNNNAGIWMGYNTTSNSGYKFRIGDPNGTGGLSFNGATGALALKGVITVSGGNAAKIDFTNVTATLDNLSDGITYKRVTANERSGAGYAYTGLDSAGDVQRMIRGPKLTGIAGSDPSGLYLTNAFFGYYNTTTDTWPVYIASSGLFYFGGDANNYIQWNGALLSIKGNVTVTGGNVVVTGGAAADVNAGATTISGSKITAGTIEASQIKAGTIEATNIRAATITTTQIAATTITGGNIATGTVTGTNIQNNTITYDKISVTSLSAIQANLGTVSLDTSGYLRSGTTTWASGTGIWMGYNTDAYKFRIGSTTGNRISWDGLNLTVQAGNISISPSGLYVPGSSTWDPVNNIRVGDIGIWGANGPAFVLVNANTGGYFGSFITYANYSFISDVVIDKSAKALYPTTSGWKLGTSASSQKWGELYVDGDIYHNPWDDDSDFNPVTYDSVFGVLREKTNGMSVSGTSCTITEIQSGIVTGAYCS